MKIYISHHAVARIEQRASLREFVEAMFEVFFGSKAVEVIENKKSSDFTGVKEQQNHKIKVGKLVIVFSADMMAVLTVNPCQLSKLKRRRKQGFLEYRKNLI